MEFLTDGILALTWQQIVMFAVGITLIWLAIKKGFEPALLLPMGFGAILVNLPFSGVLNQTLAGGIQANGVIEWLFHVGITFHRNWRYDRLRSPAFQSLFVPVWRRCTAWNFCCNFTVHHPWI